MRQNMPGWWWLVLVLQMLEPLLTHGRPTQPIWKRSSVQYQYRDRREQCDIWLDNSTTAMLDAWTALVVLWKVDSVRWSLNNVALKALPKHCTVQLMEQAKGGGILRNYKLSTDSTQHIGNVKKVLRGAGFDSVTFGLRVWRFVNWNNLTASRCTNFSHQLPMSFTKLHSPIHSESDAPYKRNQLAQWHWACGCRSQSSTEAPHCAMVTPKRGRVAIKKK